MEELFSKCDEDHSGRIELNEFVDHYLDTKNQLVEREQELITGILDSSAAIKDYQEQLQRAKTNRSQVQNSILKVFVIRAENLGDNVQ